MKDLEKIVSEVKEEGMSYLLTKWIKAKDAIPQRILVFLGLSPGEYVARRKHVEKAIEIAVWKAIQLMQEKEQEKERDTE